MFCIHCGKQIAEGETCECQNPVAENPVSQPEVAAAEAAAAENEALPTEIAAPHAPEPDFEVPAAVYENAPPVTSPAPPVAPPPPPPPVMQAPPVRPYVPQPPVQQSFAAPMPPMPAKPRNPVFTVMSIVGVVVVAAICGLFALTVFTAPVLVDGKLVTYSYSWYQVFFFTNGYTWKDYVTNAVPFVLPLVMILLFTLILRGKFRALANLLSSFFGLVSIGLFWVPFSENMSPLGIGFWAVAGGFALLFVIYLIDVITAKPKRAQPVMAAGMPGAVQGNIPSRRCQRCGTAIPAGSQFCPSCGFNG